MANEPKKDEVKAAEPKKVNLRAVHGYIQHPFTLTAFDTDSFKPHEKDVWVTIQIEAGKLEEMKAD